jgi:bifunctional DNA-binding transcriptional regulator/antitoxin component of YhaV-PrlF toxin-antitoxin module
MKMTSKGQVTIPPAMRKKHGLVPQCEIELLDQPDGVLIVKARRRSPGRRAVAALLRGGKIKARTDDWLRITRGDE